MIIRKSAEIRQLLPQKLQQQLKGYPCLLAVSLKWGEMDLTGNLNEVWKASYFEMGRVAFYNELIYPQVRGSEDFLKGVGVGPIVKNLLIEQERPVSHPDTLIIGSTIRDVENDRWIHDTVLASLNHEEICVRCASQIVAYDHTIKKKAQIPPKYISVFNKIIAEYQ